MSHFQVKLLGENAKVPTRGSEMAAGYDIYSAESCTIAARNKCLVSTEIAVAIPEGHYGRVAPRSGLASKHSIQTGAGVIDCDYRGEVKVLLFNHSDNDLHIRKHDRVAQLILEKISNFDVQVVENLEETTRNSAGFGSTGGFNS